ENFEITPKHELLPILKFHVISEVHSSVLPNRLLSLYRFINPMKAQIHCPSGSSKPLRSQALRALGSHTSQLWGRMRTSTSKFSTIMWSHDHSCPS
ncbi:unnamed protein product, partial [Prunus brigantina]